MENKNHSLKIIKTFTHPEPFDNITYLSKNTFLTKNKNGHKILNIEDNRLRTIRDTFYPMVAINQKRNLIALAHPNTITSCRLTGETTQYNRSEPHVESLNFSQYRNLFSPNIVLSLEDLKFHPRNNRLILCLRDVSGGSSIITINRFTNNSIESPILTKRTLGTVKDGVINPVEETLCVITWDNYIDLYSLNDLKKLKTIHLTTSFSFHRISHKNILALMHSGCSRISLINLNTKDNIIKNLEASTNKIFDYMAFDYMAFYPTTSILVTISSSKKFYDNQPILCFWNTTTLQPILENVLPKDSSLCDFFPDGKEMLIKSQNTYTIYSTPHVIYGEHITNTFPYILFLLKNIPTQDNPKTFLLNDIARLITYIYANKLSFY